MGSETAIQRICFRTSSGIFLRDFVTLSNDFFLPASSDSYTHNFSLGLTNFYINESLSSQKQ